MSFNYWYYKIRVADSTMKFDFVGRTEKRITCCLRNNLRASLLYHGSKEYIFGVNPYLPIHILAMLANHIEMHVNFYVSRMNGKKTKCYESHWLIASLDLYEKTHFVIKCVETNEVMYGGKQFDTFLDASKEASFLEMFLMHAWGTHKYHFYVATEWSV